MIGVLLIVALAVLLSVVAEFVLTPLLDRAFGNRPVQTDEELEDPRDAS